MDYLQLEFPIAVILVPTIGEAWSLISYHTFSYYIPPQINKNKRFGGFHRYENRQIITYCIFYGRI